MVSRKQPNAAGGRVPRTPPLPGGPRERQVVGVSLPPDVARAFKAEAAQRTMSLRNLFIEIWTEYKERKRP
jgi:hypothetical protein